MATPLLDQPKYDQSTFVGRYLHFLSIIDPRNLLYTRKQLAEARKFSRCDFFDFVSKLQPHFLFCSHFLFFEPKAVKLLEDYKSGVNRNATAEQIWEAKKIRDSMTNPDSGEIIPMPFRMAGFVPFGVPITVRSVLCGTSMFPPFLS
jgi:hypothetical protein